jgi:hypothetical protein
MTDLEISKALALAIGWKSTQMFCMGQHFYVVPSGRHRLFDYRDWNVIGPIAERYNCFPSRNGLANLWWPPQVVVGKHIGHMMHDTPQKAIALAVIEGAKK